MTDTDANKGSGYRGGVWLRHGFNAILPPAPAAMSNDRGTSSFKIADLARAGGGDKRLFNRYGIMLVSAAKHPRVRSQMASLWTGSPVSRSGSNCRLPKIGRGTALFPRRGEMIMQAE
jgi:hypothetical protein